MNVIILGAGESGVGAALLAKKQGHEVFVSDLGKIAARYKAELEKNAIPYEEGVHTREQIMKADLVIKSPGIPDKVPLIVEPNEMRTPVISEIEFASRYTEATIIGTSNAGELLPVIRTSRANSDPPIGALKVDAIPAATPEITKVLNCFGFRFNFCPTKDANPAPI